MNGAAFNLRVRLRDCNACRNLGRCTVLYAATGQEDTGVIIVSGDGTHASTSSVNPGALPATAF